MSSCPCCGKPLPDAAEAGELCSTCSDAMETGTAKDDGFQPVIHVKDFEPRKPANIHRQVTILRPLKVTLVAFSYFLWSLWLVADSIIMMIRPTSQRADISEEMMALNLMGLLLFLITGFGLWKLRYWGRQLAIAVAVVILLAGLPPTYFLWVDSRLLQLIFFWFLLKPEVRAAFDEAEDATYGEANPEQVGAL
jgi:hypothetical protein